MTPTLVVLGGLPGVGKTTIARELAMRLGAVHLRIDSIEGAIRQSGLAAGSLDDAGYRVAYAVAEDNLRVGCTVIADSVNPLPVTREAWRLVARRADAEWFEVEIVCSDSHEHRRRVEQRLTGDAAPGSPTWVDVLARDYRPWPEAHLVIDTARRTVEQSAVAIGAALSSR